MIECFLLNGNETFGKNNALKSGVCKSAAANNRYISVSEGIKVKLGCIAGIFEYRDISIVKSCILEVTVGSNARNA